MAVSFLRCGLLSLSIALSQKVSTNRGSSYSCLDKRRDVLFRPRAQPDGAVGQVRESKRRLFARRVTQLRSLPTATSCRRHHKQLSNETHQPTTLLLMDHRGDPGPTSSLHHLKPGEEVSWASPRLILLPESLGNLRPLPRQPHRPAHPAMRVTVASDDDIGRRDAPHQAGV